MTVKELIEELKDCPPDAKIFTNDDGRSFEVIGAWQERDRDSGVAYVVIS